PDLLKMNWPQAVIMRISMPIWGGLLTPMNFLNKARHQKFLGASMLLFTLSIGILIGTLVNTGVHAEKGQAAPDATPLVIPKATPLPNQFTDLAKKLEPSVVHITTDYTAKTESTSRRRRVNHL